MWYATTHFGSGILVGYEMREGLEILLKTSSTYASDASYKKNNAKSMRWVLKNSF